MKDQYVGDIGDFEKFGTASSAAGERAATRRLLDAYGS